MSLLQHLLQVLLFLLPVVWCDVNSSELCTQEEIEECNCFSYLAEQIRLNDKNLFEIKSIFYPPNDASPVFVVVTYQFGNDTTHDQVWFWTTSTFYIWQPLTVFQFTSLFFSDYTTSRHSKAHLTLPSKCNKTKESFMQLLTHRVSPPLS